MANSKIPNGFHRVMRDVTSKRITGTMQSESQELSWDSLVKAGKAIEDAIADLQAKYMALSVITVQAQSGTYHSNVTNLSLSAQGQQSKLDSGGVDSSGVIDITSFGDFYITQITNLLNHSISPTDGSGIQYGPAGAGSPTVELPAVQGAWVSNPFGAFHSRPLVFITTTTSRTITFVPKTGSGDRVMGSLVSYSRTVTPTTGVKFVYMYTNTGTNGWVEI